MLEARTIHLEPAHARYAIGYACTCAWAIVLLFSPAFGTPSTHNAAAVSMVPGLVACLGSIVFSKSFPPLSKRNALVATAGMAMAAGTLLCTHPSLAMLPTLRTGGLVLSGFFAIIVIMAWFEAFVQQPPRTIVALAGCAVSIAAGTCWGVLACPPDIASMLVSALPVLSLALLPKNDPQSTGGDRAEQTHSTAHATRTVLDAVHEAVPLRTFAGLAITFFIVRSIATLAPAYELFSAAVSPASLVVPLAITAFFIGSALMAKSIDPSILYKILLSCFAGCVFLLAFSTGITAALVFYANLVADVMMWTVLALWAKKTPVKPHFVFAIGWIAECIGNTSAQTVMAFFEGREQVFFAIAIMLIIAAVGFAFSEGRLALDVDLEDDDRPAAPEKASVGSGACPSDVSIRRNERTGEKAARGVIENGATNGGDSHGGRSETICEEAPEAARVGIPAFAQTRQEAKTGASPADALDIFVCAYGISPRERDVLSLWIAGRGMKYIENELFISESTVKSHLRSIYRKCGTHNRDETISLFERHGL